jgi:N-acetylmuramoyl-L-alanine amidase
MPRRIARFLGVATAAGLAAVLLSGAASAPARNPVRPTPAVAALGTVRISGVEYTEARSFFNRYGLKPTGLEAGSRLRLESSWTKVEIEANSREASLNGTRVFLGEPVVARDRSLFISRIDAEKVFSAILRPAGIAGAVPALRTIVIDPGHGGIDPGKQHAGLKLDEKTVALDTALRLKKLLEREGYQVVLTRTDDRHLSTDKSEDLRRRAEVANEANADLFISLHFNAVPAVDAPRVQGTETYTFTPQYQRSTADGTRLAADRVAAPGNRHDAWNAVLGYALHRQILSSLKAPDRGLKRARFAVLKFVSCPAVLIEAGFLSNDAEARRIGSAAYRDDLAAAIAAGIRAYDVQLIAARR